MSGLVELERYWTWIEAEVVRSMLESHGLHAVVFDGGLNSAEGGGLGMQARVMVLDEDHEEALRLLRANGPPGQG